MCSAWKCLQPLLYINVKYQAQILHYGQTRVLNLVAILPWHKSYLVLCLGASGWFQNCQNNWQNLVHCVPETGYPAIPLKFEHHLMLMESHSGKTSHLWRPWGSSSLFVNARLRVRRDEINPLLLNNLLYVLDQISQVWLNQEKDLDIKVWSLKQSSSFLFLNSSGCISWYLNWSTNGEIYKPFGNNSFETSTMGMGQQPA